MTKLTPESKHVLMPVRVILKRKVSKNRWVKYNWSVLDVLPGSGNNDSSIRPLLDESQDQEYDLFKVETEIDLHRAESEAYVENLGSTDPSIYVVLSPDAPDDDPTKYGITLDSVCLSPYRIQDYEDIGEDIIEKFRLDGPIAYFLEDFVKNHFKYEKFIKRKRDKKDKTDLVVEGKGDSRIRQKADVFRAPRKKN
jgi:hypothetical protein|tara:strand:- start:165 stop:752 length:588 start_codon:yes stop_codon:yes gene_type:complete